MTESRIPLTVVGGYLGAGKTTLVNRILTEDHGRRIAVIVNDFGDVAVDEALIGPAIGGIRALANGCVCCAAVDGLATALTELRELEPSPEHVIIEVSGVGDPWAVAQWGRTPGYELDGVIVIVDPVSIRRWFADAYVGETVQRQIAGADLVLISHADDAESESREVADWLVDVAAAPVRIGTDVPLALILGPATVGRTDGKSHADHSAVTFTPMPSSRHALAKWLSSAPESVVRAKGFVESDEGLLLAQRFGYRAEVVRAKRAADPVLSVVCAGSSLAADVRNWIAELEAPGPDAG